MGTPQIGSKNTYQVIRNILENTNKERWFIFILMVSLLIVVYLITTIGIFWGIFTDELYFDRINGLAIASAIIFALTCVISLTSTKLYFIILVFQLLAFPSSVDNLIPGVYFGSKDEINASVTPLFTHIDLYLLLGFLKSIIVRAGLILVKGWILILSILVLFISSMVNIFYSEDTQDFLLMISGFMHLRYLVGVYILFSLYDPLVYSKQILLGFIISILFLFVEAIIFTTLSGVDRLTSGTLGNNSFGNITACITVYFVYISKLKMPSTFRILLYFTIVVGIITVILSQTRMALLSGLILFVIGAFYYWRISFRTVFYLFIIFAVTASILFLSGVLKTKVAQRFDIGKVVSRIHISSPWSDHKMISIEYTKETASLLTRLKLYDTSMRMISSNPFFGIGSMRWNNYKSDFGFDENILLDTHNGYLAIVSQFGLFAIVFIYLIYLWPVSVLRRSIHQDIFSFLALISLGMAFCDLTNAGVYKHQIFAILSLIVVILTHVSNRKLSERYE